MTKLLRHDPRLREENGAIDQNEVLYQFKSFSKTFLDGDLKHGLIDSKEAVTQEDSSIA